MAMTSRQSKLILCLVLAVIVTACSLKSVYNRLDYLIPSYVEGMVSLDEVLEEKVEQRAQLLINWHRNTQLKKYAQLLRTFQQDIGPQLTEERLLQHIATIEAFWNSLSLKLNEEMTELLPLLDAQQRLELFESITEKNEDFQEEYVDIDEQERVELYTDRMLDNYESWLGELSEAQERAVKKAAAGLHSSAELRLQKRKLWQNSIQRILESNDDSRDKSQRLREFFENFRIDDAELAAATETNKRVIAQLTVQIIDDLSVAQKQYFFNKTGEYIRIFTELAENR